MEKLEFKKNWCEAILEYAFESKDSTDKLKPTARAIFILIKDEIDNNQ